MRRCDHVPIVRGLCGALLATALLLIPAPASAQDCPSRPWPTTQFEVVHRTHPFNFVAWLDALISGAVYDDDLEADLALADSAWERVIEDYLQDIARRLESAGFGCPNLKLYPVDGEMKYLVYLIERSDDMRHGFSSWDGAAYSTHPVIPHMLIDREAVPYVASDFDQSYLYAVLAHELFHMIQGAYDIAHSSVRFETTRLNPGFDTVVDGSADGVAWHLHDQRFPGFRDSREFRQQRLGGFDYRHMNFVEARNPDAEGPRDSPYSTSSFWLHVTERYGGLSTLEYFFRQPLAGGTVADRIRWIERGLSAPLGEVLPHFLTELASYGWTRFADISPGGWLNWTLDGCRFVTASTLPGPPLHLTLENADNTRRLRDMRPMTGNCVSAEWSVDRVPAEAGVVGLQVQIEGPSMDVLEQIHVGLANATTPGGNCWERLASLPEPARRRTSCITPADGRAHQTGSAWQKTWTFPGTFEAEGDATFVLTNIAESALDTLAADGLDVRVRFLLGSAELSVSGAVSNNVEMTLDALAGPAGLSFSVFYDPPFAPGECFIEVQLVDEVGGRRGDALDLYGLVSPPVRPGRYPIRGSGQTGGSNVFAATFSANQSGAAAYDGYGYPPFHSIGGTLDLQHVTRSGVVGRFDIALAVGTTDFVNVGGTFALPPGFFGTSAMNRLSPDNPCLPSSPPVPDVAGSGGTPARAAPPDAPPAAPPPSAGPGRGAAAGRGGILPGTPAGRAAGPGRGTGPGGVGAESPDLAGRGLAGPGLTLQFLDDGPGLLRSAPQAVQGTGSPTQVAVSSGAFTLALALPEETFLTQCAFRQTDPDANLALLAVLGMARSQGGRLLIDVADGSLRLDATTGAVQLELGFARGTIAVRGVAPAVVGLTPGGQTTVRGDVTGGTLDVTIDRQRVTCDGLMDFAFLVTGAR